MSDIRVYVCMRWMRGVFYEELCGAVKSIRSLHYHNKIRGARLSGLPFAGRPAAVFPSAPFFHAASA